MELKSQEHNKGKLATLKVEIEEDIVETFKKMSENSGISIDELVVIALKRYRASHAELEGKAPLID